MPYRSFDFERIYNEFLNCYSTRQEAEREYYAWLKVMQLDESREYGQARESFYWKKDDLRFVREDMLNKYYEVELGFPTRSMNGNVYRKRDLIAAATSLKGKHPSLNHKDEYWFSPKNPRNRWGNISILEGKFHEGICKALVAVPKDMLCPVCESNKKFYELIDEKRIYNVSLEGDCAGGQCYDGTCEGFYFTDPPFTFLTTDVLPGIPMTRIKPIESWLPVSQSSITRGKIKPLIKENEKLTKNVIKIKPKLKEDTFQNAQQPEVNVNTKSIVTPLRGDWGTPIQSDPNLHSETQSSGNVTVPVGTSAGTHQMQSGYPEAKKQPPIPRTAEAMAEPFGDFDNWDACIAWATAQPDIDNPEAYCGKLKADIEEKRKEEQAPDRETDAPPSLPSTSPPEGEPGEEGPKKTKPETESPAAEQPTGAPAEIPAVTTPETELGTEPPKAADKVVMGDSPSEQAEEPTQACPEGYHRDENDDCVPNEPSTESLPSLEERKARIKAELKAASASEKAIAWEQKHNEVYEKLKLVTATLKELNRQHNTLKAEIKREREQTNSRMESLVAKAEQYKMQYNSVCGDLTKTQNALSEARELATKKADDANRAWDAAKKQTIIATKANEDYIEIAKKNEQLEEAMRKKDIMNKKALKIKV